MDGQFEKISDEVERVAAAVIEAAFRVHRNLGPGLLEGVYEVCLCRELSKAGISFERQPCCPILYDGMRLEADLRLDLLVNNQVVVELKAVEQHLPLYEAQLLTYLKLSGKRLGLLINFNVPKLRDGIKRLVL